MNIRGLELTNFRSYERAVFELHPEVTIVVGPNASGKTNLLESLYVIASTKSFRAKDRDLVRHDQDFYRIVVTGDDMTCALGVSTAGGVLEKRVTHNNVKRTLVSHVGQIQVALFEPQDLQLVSGPPEGRRKYLDFLLCQTDRRYLKTLSSYKRVLRQRNALLEGSQPEAVRRDIFAWDLQLVELARDIHDHRLVLIEALNTSLPSLYRDIAGEDVPMHLQYLPSIEASDYGSGFAEALQRNLARDMGAGFTTIGPHREDFKIHFKNNDITAVASRGETRTLVLALKLAELAYAEERTGTRPILLLDDVFSELDHDRRTYLLHRLGGFQTVITTTDADSIMREITAAHSVISTETSYA